MGVYALHNLGKLESVPNDDRVVNAARGQELVVVGPGQVENVSVVSSQSKCTFPVLDVIIACALIYKRKFNESFVIYNDQYEVNQ
jgi:hypothetical protein